MSPSLIWHRPAVADRTKKEVGSTGQGKREGEGMVGESDAPSNRTWSALGQVAKNMVGSGPSSKGFHTFTAVRTNSVPEEAVEKGARKPKDTQVGAQQTPHLPHHAAEAGDQMPAVKNNASLPSKKGESAADQVSSSGKGTNLSKGPAHEKRPTGTADTPGSRAVDLDSQEHSPSFEDGPRWV